MHRASQKQIQGCDCSLLVPSLTPFSTLPLYCQILYVYIMGSSPGAMGELVGGQTLHSLKLNYMQKCVYMFPMCIFLKRVHSCHQISKEVYDPKRVKNHCPKLIKTSLGVSSGVLILANGQSRISQPSFLQGAKTASRYWSLHAQQSAYHYSFFPHPFIHLICIHFHCPIHVPAPVKHTPGQDR